MSIRFNHTIVAAQDRHISAAFFTHLFGLPEPTTWGPFVSVRLDEGVFLQFAEPDINDIQMQHYAFLVDDQSFDEIYARILQGGIEHWADPQATPRRPSPVASIPIMVDGASTSATQPGTA